MGEGDCDSAFSLATSLVVPRPRGWLGPRLGLALHVSVILRIGYGEDGRDTLELSSTPGSGRVIY